MVRISKGEGRKLKIFRSINNNFSFFCEGFFDNLFETDMLLVLSRSDDPINCAKSMADAAMRNAKSKTVRKKKSKI